MLANWAVQNSIACTALNGLLKLLNDYGHTQLPLDSRTLLQTPKNFDKKILKSGTYVHFGIERAIKYQILENCIKTNQLYIDICFDGLPISKSSSVAFWPILGKINSTWEKLPPFLIGIFYGMSKPDSASDYLADFVQEYLAISSNGIVHNGHTIQIKIRAFICDAPATAFVKCIKGHSGYFSCGKCMQEGNYIKNRVSFSAIESDLRTDENFVSRLQKEHHLAKSPLEQLNIGMVSQFPLDYLHLVCLGVTKKLIELWTEGPLQVRVSSYQVRKINQELSLFEKTRPTEINRQIRKLELYKIWKATEFRTFLLYTGIVALKNNVKDAVYENFLLLSCAIRILCDDKMCHRYNELAKQLLIQFVHTFKTLYGACYISYNIHNLLHLSSDVNRLGNLDNFSAFPFETYMYTLKRLIKKGNKQLEQVLNRITEKCENMVVKNVPKKDNFPKLSKKNNTSIFKDSSQYNKLSFNTFLLKTDAKNKWFIVNESFEIYMFLYVFEFKNSTKIYCKRLQKHQHFFETPFLSKNIHIFLSNNIKFDEPIFLPTNTNISKLFAIEQPNFNDDSDEIHSNISKKTVFIQLLHT